MTEDEGATGRHRAQAREHELKCWPEYFGRVLDGTKTFEVRRDDRGFQVGDVLWLREFEPLKPSAHYTGRELRVTVTYVLHGIRWGATEAEHVVMGFRPVAAALAAAEAPPAPGEASYADVARLTEQALAISQILASAGIGGGVSLVEGVRQLWIQRDEPRAANPYAVFEPWIVKRPRGGCTVEFPLSKLDELVDTVLSTYTSDDEAVQLEAEIDRLKGLWSVQQDRALRAEDECKSLQQDIVRLRAALAAAEAHAECPHGGNCGCSIATRHEWYEWKGDERLKREAAEARVAQLEQLVREMLDAKNLIEEDAMKAEGDNRTGVALLQRRLTLANEMREAAEAQAAQLQQKIDEAVVNCPSCGRHDFGLWTQVFAENARLRAALEQIAETPIVAARDAVDAAFTMRTVAQAALKAQP